MFYMNLISGATPRDDSLCRPPPQTKPSQRRTHWERSNAESERFNALRSNQRQQRRDSDLADLSLPHRFTVVFDSIALYENEERTTSFVALDVGPGKDQVICSNPWVQTAHFLVLGGPIWCQVGVKFPQCWCSPIEVSSVWIIFTCMDFCVFVDTDMSPVQCRCSSS